MVSIKDIFFSELCEFSLLTREGEVELARRIERGHEKVLRAVAQSSLPEQKIYQEVIADRQSLQTLVAHKDKMRLLIELVERDVNLLRHLREKLRLQEERAGVNTDGANRKTTAQISDSMKLIERKFGMPHGKIDELWTVIDEGRRQANEAREILIESNLSLVVWTAKRYAGLDLPLLDLIQEGSFGLMKAVDRFDYRRTFRFSTYAGWWIWQSITRALAEKARPIRLPVHLQESRKKIETAKKQFFSTHHRYPSMDELADYLNFSTRKIANVMTETSYHSGDQLPRRADDENTIENWIKDERSALPDGEVIEKQLLKRTAEALATLTPRERAIIRLRFGIGQDRDYTLKEVGKKFGVCRERIRQIESTALTKIRNLPAGSNLAEFLDR